MTDTDQPGYHSRRYQCGVCHYSTPKIGHLKRHMEYHATDKVSMYECPVCRKSLRCFEQFCQHVEKQHPTKIYEKKTFRVPEAIYFHFCKVCHIAYSTPSGLERHLFTDEHYAKMPKDYSILNNNSSLTIDKNKILKKGDENRIAPYRVHGGVKTRIKTYYKTLKDFQCDLCNVRLADRITITRHMQAHFGIQREFVSQRTEAGHPYKRIVQCGQCHYQTSNKGHLKRHMTCHITAKCLLYACPACGKRMRNFEQLKTHAISLHPDTSSDIIENNRFKLPESACFHFCDECGMSFSTPDDIERHDKYFHEDITSNDLRDYAIFKQKERIKALKQSSCEGVFTCTLCSKGFQSREELQQHQTVRSGLQWVLERQTRTTQNVKAGGDVEQLSVIRKIDRELFVHNTFPRKHKFQCGKCDSSFRYLSKLKRHIARTHDKLKTELCEYCGILFVRNEKLKNHIRSKHEKSKQLRCDFCNKMFGCRNTIKSHMLHHFDLHRKYTCEICRNVYKGLASYNVHVQTHGDEFVCKCGQKFSRKQTLIHHQKAKHGRNPFKCTTCEKTFSNPGALNIHERIHREDKRHTCTMCEKSFVQSYSLKVHMRVHTKEQPFKCDKCDAKYTQSYPLTLHKRKHHSK